MSFSRRLLLLAACICVVEWGIVLGLCFTKTQTGAYMREFTRTLPHNLKAASLQYSTILISIMLARFICKMDIKSFLFSSFMCFLSLSLVYAYFAFKTAGCGVSGSSTFLGRLEYPLWEHILPALKHIPSSFFRLLDKVYTSGWEVYTVGLFALPLLLFKKQESAVFYGTIILTNPIWVLVNYFWPTLSPIYVYGKTAFPFLPSDLASLKAHASSIQVTHLIQLTPHNLAHLSFPFQPVASFPSWHVGFTFFSWMFFRLYAKNVFKWISSGMFLLVFAGSLFLGFHYLIDDVAGMAVFAAVLCFLKKGGEMECSEGLTNVVGR